MTDTIPAFNDPSVFKRRNIQQIYSTMKNSRDWEARKKSLISALTCDNSLGFGESGFFTSVYFHTLMRKNKNDFLVIIILFQKRGNGGTGGDG